MRDDPLTVAIHPGRHDDVTIVELSGPLTLANLFPIQERLSQTKPAVLIIDLTQCPYMDSAGLGLLMNTYVSAEKNGRTFLLAGVSERASTLLQMTKVHLILKNYPTAAEAEASARP